MSLSDPLPTPAEQLEAVLYDWECRQLLRRQLDDVLFYQRHARGEVLELACGTGRVSEALMDSGFALTAVDLHAGMLQRARHRLGSQCTLRQGDMRTLDLDRTYDTVIIAYNSFQLLHTREEQEACLRGIYRHLVDGGCLLLEVTPFLLRDPPSGWSHRATAPLHDDPVASGDATVAAAWERCRTTPARQLNHFDTRFVLFGPDASRVERLHTLTLRTVFRFELELLLEKQGFVIEVVDGDYDGTPLEECDDEGMVVMARKH